MLCFKCEMSDIFKMFQRAPLPIFASKVIIKAMFTFFVENYEQVTVGSFFEFDILHKC